MKTLTLVAVFFLTIATSAVQAGDAVPFRVTPGFTILANPTPELLPAPKVKEPSKQSTATAVAQSTAQPAKSVYQFANTPVPPCPAPGPGWVWDGVDGSFIRIDPPMLYTNLTTGQLVTQAQTVCTNAQCTTTTAVMQSATTPTVMPAPVVSTPRFMSFVPNVVGAISNCSNGKCTTTTTRK